MSQLKIYKASAGSGKTFRLAVDYLKLILENPNWYKNILAVTFTNKATAEMKSRVLKELHELSKGEKTNYLAVLVDELELPEWQIAEKAKKALSKILHDYSRFSISTIDSFFQRIIKAFNRELGINSAYSVELEENQILEEAVDRLIISVEDDLRLRAWLKEFAENNIREGKGWNLKKDILQLGKEIYNDSFRTLNEELYKKLNDKSFISGYRKELNKIIHQFEKTLKSFGNGGISIITENGLLTSDFKGGKNGVANSFVKIANGKYEFTRTAINATVDIDAWYTKTAVANVKEAADKLMPILRNAVDFYDANIVSYNSAKLISDQLYVLGILVDLRKVVREICKEKGIILISDSGQFINDIIDDSDAPFLYEKTGVFYKHFMIDEFQDTSALQWKNFKPLVMNSMAENNFNLVVGDVKQAIYRWRKGDWNLLSGELENSLGFYNVENAVLNKNWRSCGNIIRFNNTIFTHAPAILQYKIENELEEANANIDLKPIHELYADRIQEIGRDELAETGNFRIKFLEASAKNKEDNHLLIEKELTDKIIQLQDMGIKAKNMAVLVRTKKEAKQIADLLLEAKSQNPNYNFNVLSNESLYLNSSPLVNFICNLLEFYLNREDQLILSTLNYLYYSFLYPVLEKTGTLPDFTDRGQQQASLDFTKAYSPELSEQLENTDNKENGFIQFISTEAFNQWLSGKSLQEMVFGICEKFSLFSVTDELAYLQAFIDQLAVFEQGNSAEISSFLNWWEENKTNITISVSEHIDAINILTIHKSKGLEFDHVFIPFCDWSMQPSAQHAPLLWCEPATTPFSELELVPVKFKKDMARSVFSTDYFKEKYNTYIDNLNLLYVAFTRAESGLYVWSQVSGKMTTIGDLLKIAVTTPLSSEKQKLIELNQLFDEEQKIIEYGEITINNNKEQKKSNSIILNEFKFSDFRKHLSIRKYAEDLLAEDGKLKSAINKGKILHEILANISHKNELDKAIQSIVISGKILKTEAADYRNELEKMIHDPEINTWFDGTYKIFNERNLLDDQSDRLKRPDRIMINGDKLIVVDYKSGDLELEKHRTQLRSYVALLKRCGYTKVKAYLWYTKNNHRVEL